MLKLKTINGVEAYFHVYSEYSPQVFLATVSCCLNYNYYLLHSYYVSGSMPGALHMSLQQSCNLYNPYFMAEEIWHLRGIEIYTRKQNQQSPNSPPGCLSYQTTLEICPPIQIWGSILQKKFPSSLINFSIL